MSLSTVIQGLLVAQLPEYEISNEAIGYLSNFSGKVLSKLVYESVNINNASISYTEVKAAINKVFPRAWTPLIFREVSNQVSHQQPDDRESILKNELSDFEIIDDGHQVPKVENKNAGNLFMSAEFIKSYLPSNVASIIDTQGCMYLSVSLESVLSKLIQQSRVALEQHEDPFVITKESIDQAIDQDSMLADLNNAILIPNQDEASDFEVVEGDDIQEHKFETESNPIEPVKLAESTENSAGEVPVPIKEEPEPIEEKQASIEEPSPIEEEPAPVEEEPAPVEEEPALIEEEPMPTSNPATESIYGQELTSPISDNVVEEIPTFVSEVLEPTINTAEPVTQKLEPEQIDVVNSPPKPDILDFPSPEQSSAPALDLNNATKLIKAKKPVSELYGRCCPYFDMTTLAIHMLSSIMELFLLHLVTETCSIAHPHKRAVKHQVREALARLTSSKILPQNEIPHAESRIFDECVDSSVTIVSTQVEYDTDVRTYISDAIMYISTRILLGAAAQARTAGDWIINSNTIATTTTNLVVSAPITKLIKKLQSSLEGEGSIITPPPTPRIRAAEMIYLTSLYKETPLQLDNQLLVIFMFLVSLSLHTLCCVK